MRGDTDWPRSCPAPDESGMEEETEDGEESTLWDGRNLVGRWSDVDERKVKMRG